MKADLEAAISKANDDLRVAVDAEKESGRIAWEAAVQEWIARVAEKDDALTAATAELDAMKTKYGVYCVLCNSTVVINNTISLQV